MMPTTFVGEDRLRTASLTNTRWLLSAQLWRPHDPDLIVTSDAETAVVLLAGTFDLIGGTTAWPARGARQTAFEGRPMAVFLPKHTEFRTQNGRGEILMVSARQPTAPSPLEGRAVLSSKPLLALAGSGKAFDPNSGEWRPAETFPTAPESLPPRRMERIAVGDLTVERVLAPDYKAATLSIDEVVLPPGAQLSLRDVPGRAKCDEVLVFVRTEGEAAFGTDAAPCKVHDDAVFLVASDQVDAMMVRAILHRSYVVLAYAGKG